MVENEHVAPTSPPRVMYLWLESLDAQGYDIRLAKQRWLRKHHLDGKGGTGETKPADIKSSFFCD
jgi:hypothetical protein